MSEKLSKDKIDEIRQLSQGGKSNREIWRLLEVDHTTVGKYTAWIVKETKKEVEETIKQDSYTEDIEKKEIKSNITILKKKYGDVLEKLENQNKMLEIFEEVKKKREYKPIEKKKWEENTQSVANLDFSDLHIEETVDKETINGLNEYNPEIAQQRSEQMFIRFVELVQSLKQSEHIHWVIVHLLGDFISWYIHPELVEGNAMSPTEAMLLAQKVIVKWINYILENTDEDITIATAFGNHGRTTDKKRVSTWRKNSYEWLMYNIIAMHYQNNPRVQFKIEKGNINYVNVYDKVIADMHGDMIKYQGWVGWITIPMNKAIGQRQKAKQADVYNSGHRHQLRDWGLWVTNGSVIGYNNYAESIKADYEQAKQLMFLINSKYGKTITAPIILS